MATRTSLADLIVQVRADMDKLKEDVIKGSEDSGKKGGEKLGKTLGDKLNSQLKSLKVDEIDIKADPKKALDAIDRTEARLKALARDSATVEIKVQTEKALAELGRFKKSIGNVADDVGPSFGKTLVSGIGDAIGAGQAALLPIVGGLAIAAAPLIGATIAGAVVGAAGIGGVAGGLVLAAKNPQVKAAATALGQEVMQGLMSRSEVFVAPALQGLQKIRGAWHDFDGDLQKIFDSSSKFVSPLIDGLLSGALKVGHGFANAVAAAKPVIDQLGRTFDEVGGAVGEVFTNMGAHAEEGALAIRDLTDATVGLINGVNDVIGPLATVFGWLSKANAAFKTFTGGLSILQSLNPLEPLKLLYDGIKQVTGNSDEGAKSLGKWNDGVAGAAQSAESLGTGAVSATHSVAAAGTAAAASAPQIKTFDDRMRDAAASVRSFSDAIDAAFSQQMNLDRATIALVEGRKALRDELNSGTRTLGLNSAEGIRNRKAVLDQLSAIEALRQARFDETGSTQQSTAEYNKNIRSLRAAAVAAGFNRAEVDKLIGTYKKVPGKVNTVIGTPGLPQSDAGIKNYDKKLDALARFIKTNVTVTGDRIAYGKLQALLIQQQALKKGISVSAATSAFNKNAKAAGGPIKGPGTATSDSIPAWLSNDEYVVKAASAKKVGVDRLNYINATGQLPMYAGGGTVLNAPFPVNAGVTRIPSVAEALSVIIPDFGNWPASPAAQRGDSGVWRRIVALIRSTGPISGSFGNAYRAGDPLWHGSGRAVDWMGFNQDKLATFLAGKRPLELIHRTASRDFAYTRGVNKGSFNEGLMNAHRNHVHIAMRKGGPVPYSSTVARVAKVAMADSGNMTLERGWNLIGNGTGQREAMTTAGGEVVEFHAHFHGPVASKQAAKDMILDAYNALVREKKIPQVKR